VITANEIILSPLSAGEHDGHLLLSVRDLRHYANGYKWDNGTREESGSSKEDWRGRVPFLLPNIAISRPLQDSSFSNTEYRLRIDGLCGPANKTTTH